MAEWVILKLPAVLILYGAALAASLFERFTRATKGVLTYLAAGLAILAAACALLCGASLWEGAALLLVFLLLHMGVKA